MVGGEAELGAGGHDARELVDERRLEQPPAVVAALRPGVGEEDEDALQAGAAGSAATSALASSGKTRTLPRPPSSTSASRLAMPFQVRLAADYRRVRAPCRLPRQVLAAAEADLEPQRRPGRGAEGRARVGDAAAGGDVDANLGQQPGEQRAAAGAEPGPAAAAVERRRPRALSRRRS